MSAIVAIVATHQQELPTRNSIQLPVIPFSKPINLGVCPYFASENHCCPDCEELGNDLCDPTSAPAISCQQERICDHMRHRHPSEIDCKGCACRG